MELRITAWLRTHLGLLLALGAVALIYLNLLPNTFVLDDETFVSWPLIRNVKNIPLFFTGTLPDTHFGDYRPLKGIILTLNYALFGKEPIGYLVQALGIHLSATVLVYFILFKLTKQPLLATIGSLLFGLHPVQVEAIAFITSSSDMMGIVFYLAAFYLFLVSRPRLDTSSILTSVPVTRPQKIRWKYLGASLFFFALGLLSYEMVLTLPLTIGLYVFCFERKKLSVLIAVLGPYLIITALYVWIRLMILQVLNQENYLLDSFWVTLLVTFAIIRYYWQLLLFPLHLNINPEILPGIYAYKDVDIDPTTLTVPQWWQLPVLSSIGLILVLSLLALTTRKKYPIVTFSLGWMLLTVLPVLNLLPLSALMAERYLYIALLGFGLLVGWLLFKSSTLLKQLSAATFIRFGFWGLVGMWVGLLGMRSYIRISDWRNSQTLWTSTLQLSPASVLAHHNLGMAYFSQGNLEKTLYYLSYAAEHNVHHIPKIHLNLGKAYLAAKNYQLALTQFEKAVAIDSQFAEGLFYVGNAQQELGLLQEAEEAYGKTLTLNPQFTDAHAQLGKMYYRQGNITQAIGEYETAISKNPLLFPAYYDLAALYIKANRTQDALSILEIALAHDPKNPKLISTIDLLKQR